MPENKKPKPNPTKIIAQLTHHAESDCACNNCVLKRAIEDTTDREVLYAALGEILWKLTYTDGRAFVEGVLSQALPKLEEDLRMLSLLRDVEA